LQPKSVTFIGKKQLQANFHQLAYAKHFKLFFCWWCCCGRNGRGLQTQMTLVIFTTRCYQNKCATLFFIATQLQFAFTQFRVTIKTNVHCFFTHVYWAQCYIHLSTRG